MECVYVANLPPDIRIKDIDDFFRPFGKLVFIDVNHRANPVYAYVQFDSPRNAFNAVKARHGYDYEGYTLQLRMVENEVRRRRDVTPPPPPPPIFKNSYDRPSNGEFGNNFGRIATNFPANSSSSHWSSNNHYDMQQFSTINRPNMSQQNRTYSTSNRYNLEQSNMPFSSEGRSNIDQQFSNATRLSMQQHFSTASSLNMQSQSFTINRSNMDRQFSNAISLNMPLQNNFENRRDITQENKSPYYSHSNMQQQYADNSRSDILQQYTDSSRSNIPKLQNMNIQNPNNSFNIERNDMGWSIGRNNFNAINSNGGANVTHNPRREDRYTSGLSGAGRKWFDRYIRNGYSPERARAKALEHRKVPYLRDERRNKPIPNNSTNMALESIGNTIISFLSSNSADDIQPGFDNNMDSRNVQIARPSSSVPSQAQFNVASRRQYIKSLDFLKMIEKRRVKTAKDRISLKYHSQIVKDYRKFNKMTPNRKDEISRHSTLRNASSRNRTSGNESSKTPIAEKSYKPIISTCSEEQLRELMTKEKAKLLKSAKELGYEAGEKKRLGGAHRKRTKLLMDHGFLEIEAKSLAWNHIEKLEKLLSLKTEYDFVTKKTDFLQSNKKILSGEGKSVVYRNDLKYLEEYSKHRIKELSKTILYGLNKCINRIHDYEKSENLPLTENKFTKLLLKITSREGFFKSSYKKPTRRGRRGGAKGFDTKNKVDSKISEAKKDNMDNKDSENIDEDNKVNEPNKEYEESQDNEDQINDEILDNGEQVNENNGYEENRDNEDNHYKEVYEENLGVSDYEVYEEAADGRNEE